MRGHDNKVAALVGGNLDDGFVGLIVNLLHSVTGNANCFGAPSNVMQNLASMFFDMRGVRGEFLWHRIHLRLGHIEYVE